MFWSVAFPLKIRNNESLNLGILHHSVNIVLETSVPNLVSGNLPQFSDIGENLDVVISNFQISGRLLINKIFRNSRTSNNISMKFGLVTKLYKRNMEDQKQIDMSTNCDVIAIFPIYGQFGEMRKPDSGRMVRGTYNSINNNLLSYKNWKKKNL